MKTYNKLLLLVFLSVSLFSCSKDQVDAINNLHGIWDNVRVEGDEIYTYRLVFAKNNAGAEVQITELTTGESASSISSFDWEINNDTVEIMDGEDVKATYFINASGQLVSHVSGNLVLDKVSDDYSEY